MVSPKSESKADFCVKAAFFFMPTFAFVTNTLRKMKKSISTDSVRRNSLQRGISIVNVKKIIGKWHITL